MNFNSDEALTKVLAMKDKELRIFIAQYLFPQFPIYVVGGGYGELRHQYPEGATGPVNKYPYSLDAMADAEVVFDKDIQSGNSPRYIYSRWVYKVTELEPNRQPFRATARQRAQAFVLTVMEMRSYEQDKPDGKAGS